MMSKIMNKDKVGLFDFLKAISDTKEELFELEDFDRKYPPFMINRFLSVSQDTLFFANIISQFPDLPKKLQYAFYHYGIDKKKRYFQYAGKGKDNTKHLKDIVRYYCCSKEQGMEYLELLSKEQIQNIGSLYSKRIQKGK